MIIIVIVTVIVTYSSTIMILYTNAIVFVLASLFIFLDLTQNSFPPFLFFPFFLVPPSLLPSFFLPFFLSFFLSFHNFSMYLSMYVSTYLSTWICFIILFSLLFLFQLLLKMNIYTALQLWLAWLSDQSQSYIPSYFIIKKILSKVRNKVIHTMILYFLSPYAWTS